MQSQSANVKFCDANFLLSATAIKHLPPDSGREIAFLGRSNAGKSSMINALCRRSNLARTSKTPGRTQSINVYVVDAARRLVDLPGLGYAEVSKSTRTEWRNLIGEYLSRRCSLAGLIYLSDIRHPLLDIDLQALHTIQEHQLALCVALSKADKLGRSLQQQALHTSCRKLALAGVQAHVLNFSARTGMGLDEIRSLAQLWLTEIDDNQSDTTIS